MSMGDPCEVCGAQPPRAEKGPFAGSLLFHDYCNHCSRDLCDKCMETSKCRESPDGKHAPNSEDEDEELA